jgi:5-hydroxyisourate hydrolase
MPGITTHVLDLTLGRPVAGLTVRLERRDGEGSWRLRAEAATDGDGRVQDWPGAPALAPGPHRLTFLVGGAFYPEISVVFLAEGRSHVPLLLGPFGYTTYRGS